MKCGHFCLLLKKKCKKKISASFLTSHTTGIARSQGCLNVCEIFIFMDQVSSVRFPYKNCEHVSCISCFWGAWCISLFSTRTRASVQACVCAARLWHTTLIKQWSGKHWDMRVASCTGTVFKPGGAQGCKSCTGVYVLYSGQQIHNNQTGHQRRCCNCPSFPYHDISFYLRMMIFKI